MRPETPSASKNVQASRQGRIPRAELWICSEVFHQLGIEDTIHGHLEFRNTTGMDMLFLPISETETRSQTCHYRYFTPEDVLVAHDYGALPIGVILDGPLQCYLGKRDFMTGLLEANRKAAPVVDELRREMGRLQDVIRRCVRSGAKYVVIADDIAWDKSLFCAPAVLEELLLEPYGEIVSTIHAEGGLALFHSCGNFSRFLAQLVGYGFDGLAGFQNELMEPAGIDATYGVRLLLFTGLDAQTLNMDHCSKLPPYKFLELVKRFENSGNFVVTSSCGLLTKESVGRLRRIYDLVDQP